MVDSMLRQRLLHGIEEFQHRQIPSEVFFSDYISGGITSIDKGICVIAKFLSTYYDCTGYWCEDNENDVGTYIKCFLGSNEDFPDHPSLFRGQ